MYEVGLGEMILFGSSMAFATAWMDRYLQHRKANKRIESLEKQVKSGLDYLSYEKGLTADANREIKRLKGVRADVGLIFMFRRVLKDDFINTTGNLKFRLHGETFTLKRQSVSQNEVFVEVLTYKGYFVRAVDPREDELALEVLTGKHYIKENKRK